MLSERLDSACPQVYNALAGELSKSCRHTLGLDKFGKLWEQMGPPVPTRPLLTYSWHSKRHRLHLHKALDQLAHRCGNEANSCGLHALAGNPQTL